MLKPQIHQPLLDALEVELKYSGRKATSESRRRIMRLLDELEQAQRTSRIRLAHAETVCCARLEETTDVCEPNIWLAAVECA